MHRNYYLKLESLQQVCIISSPTAWGKEKYVQIGFHTCWTMNKEPHIVRTTIHLQRWRHEGNEFLDCIFAVEKSQMHSFDL